MVNRISLVCLLCLAGCAGMTGEHEPAESPVEAPPAVVEAAVPLPPEPDPLAEACEALLMRLEETQPMLAEVDASLAAQAERFDAAIANLNQPAPENRGASCPPSLVASVAGKEVIGEVEWIYMDPPGEHYRARVDTGVETSSLSANDVVLFERDGDDWVRFAFEHENIDDSVEIELPVKRTALFRQVSTEEPMRRYVIELDIRLGDQLHTTEFTLTDRNNMTFPISLGRSFLLDLYIVDVSRTLTRERYDGS
jgi:hypothetical protein